MKHHPKFVRKANMYVVTVDEGTVKVKNVMKTKQTQHWFPTEEEAKQFYIS